MSVVHRHEGPMTNNVQGVAIRRLIKGVSSRVVRKKKKKKEKTAAEIWPPLALLFIK